MRATQSLQFTRPSGWASTILTLRRTMETPDLSRCGDGGHAQVCKAAGWDPQLCIIYRHRQASLCMPRFSAGH